MLDSDQKKNRIEKLKNQIDQCRRCRLYKTRTHTVPGEGSVYASLMFIGEAPGRNEDLQGKPFVGRAGKVFDELLSSVGLERHQIYLCNILKCRPPGNRNPLSDEIQACVGALDIQIKVIQPRVIIPLGNFSATYIFQKFSLLPEKISNIRGRVFQTKGSLGEIKIVPLFHPAVATYDVNKLDILLKDFQVLKTLST